MNTRTKIIGGAVAAVVAALAVSGAAVALRSDDELSGDARARAGEAALAEVGPGTVVGAERDDGGYEVEVVRPDGSSVEAHLSPELEVLWSEEDERDEWDDRDGRWDERGGRDDDVVDAPTRASAQAAALREVPGGIVTDIDRAGVGYEVEVVRPDGIEVDVRLDEGFAVTAVRTDPDD
jgi:uncharacterized membrane protein YkoI